MDLLSLRKAFAKLYHQVDRYFDYELCKNPYTYPGVEMHKKILMSNLFEELVRIHEMKTYSTYPPEKLIGVKKRRVFSDYIKSLKWETKRQKKVTTDQVPANYKAENFQDELEARNALILVRAFLNPQDYELLLNIARGFTYKQIWLIGKYSSPGAAKTRYHRVMKDVSEHFRIQISKN